VVAAPNPQRQYAVLPRPGPAPGDHELRQRLLAEAVAFYERAGLTERVAQLAPQLEGAPGSAAAPPDLARWERTGAGWSVTFRGRTAALPPVKGMADLARLLARPEAELHVLDLVGPGGAAAPRQGDAGVVLDDRARAAYQQRLRDLAEQIADAEADGDGEALARATGEREFLVAELTGAFGLGGRPRRVGDPAERARTTVTSRIRDALGRVDLAHPELGRHLRASVRTGTFCSYAPEQPVVWDVSTGGSPTS
jgi:hypothetical protein